MRITKSKAKPLPMPREQMITRQEIRDITGASHDQMAYCIKHKPNGFPDVVHIGRAGALYFVKAEFMAWRENNNICRIIPKEYYSQGIGEENSAFDNKAAVKFLSRPPIVDEEITLSSIINKHCRKFGKTKTVHLQERNDYVPPRNDLMMYGNSSNHRIHVLEAF